MDETRVKEDLHSFVRNNEPPMGITAPELVTRGRRVRNRRWMAMGAAATAVAMALAVVGLPVVTHGKVSFDPAGLLRSLGQSPAERIDELLRANMPRSDEFELKEIKAFRWDEREPLPKSRLNEATSWVVIYNLDTGNDYIQQIRVSLGYFPQKQWPPIVDGCRYPTTTAADQAILYYWGRMSRDLRTPASAESPGYLVSVDAREEGYNVVGGLNLAPKGERVAPTPKVLPSPQPGATRPSRSKEKPKPAGDGDGGPMTGGYSFEHQQQAASDPDLVFDPPATWPENVESPIPLTRDQEIVLDTAHRFWGVKDDNC